MASLILAFSDLYNEVLRATGEYNSGSPSTTASDTAKRVVNRAYQRFVNAHDWTFLNVLGHLLTEDGKDAYELPTDFAYLTRDQFTFDNAAYYSPTQSRPLMWIQNQRVNLDWESYPEYHAIHASPYTKEVGQRWQVAFYPTPDAAYKLWFPYRLNPAKLENDADIPIGGAEASDYLLELCLAYAETSKDEKADIHNVKVQEIVAPLIDIDKRRRPSGLGNMGTGTARPQYGGVLETGTVTYTT